MKSPTMDQLLESARQFYEDWWREEEARKAAKAEKARQPGPGRGRRPGAGKPTGPGGKLTKAAEKAAGIKERKAERAAIKLELEARRATKLEAAKADRAAKLAVRAETIKRLLAQGRTWAQASEALGVSIQRATQIVIAADGAAAWRAARAIVKAERKAKAATAREVKAAGKAAEAARKAAVNAGLVEHIRLLLEQGKTWMQIAQELERPFSTVRSIWGKAAQRDKG